MESQAKNLLRYLLVKTIIPINRAFSEQSINFGLKKASDAGYDHEVLEDSVDDMLDIL